jgi:hypothetical protein
LQNLFPIFVSPKWRNRVSQAATTSGVGTVITNPNYCPLNPYFMKKTYLLLSFFLIILGCSSDAPDDSENQYHVNAYFFNYMDYPEGVDMSMVHENNLAKITYNNSYHILKRTGGLRSVDPASGFNYIFSDEIYDTITYSENQILVKQKLDSPIFNVPLFERKLFLNHQHRITKKFIYREYYGLSIVDTVYYNYNSSGKLTESRKGKVDHKTESSKYYFNENNNLDSIVTKKYYFDYLEQKTVELFSDYDNATNPLKNLVIFEETFNRSLSKNNYRKYEVRNYRSVNNFEEESAIKTWSLIYDTQGEVAFDNY